MNHPISHRMKHLLSNLKISVPESIFIKDPETSKLGKRIIEHSIHLIHEIGFESFTFKKLGKEIQSNESSIYRYFESKHKLLVYLTAWYWAWIEYQLVFETTNISDPEEKLKSGILVVTRAIKEDSNFSHINEIKLNQIIINENSKSFLTKDVDEENKQGHFRLYKRVVLRIKELIIEVNPDYPFPCSLSSTILEGALHQYFLKDHLTTITDCKKDVTPTDFIIDMVLRVLK